MNKFGQVQYTPISVIRTENIVSIHVHVYKKWLVLLIHFAQMYSKLSMYG